jgi:thiamine-phosphate pyrophosphorylase
MDTKLVAWARAVKARRGGCLPALWLFTDDARLPDPVAAARRLPRGLAGIVLRDDSRPDRRALAKSLARICRQRRLCLSVAGDWRLAASLRAGVHLRAGWRLAGMPRAMTVLTSSAHGVADGVRARRARASLVFLSPVFATASHPGASAIGPVRWGLSARRFAAAGALGGIDGGSVHRLPHGCGAIGAIAALATDFSRNEGLRPGGL